MAKKTMSQEETTTVTKKKGWPKIGTLRKNDDGSSYIKLEEGVEVFVGGAKVELNEKRIVRLQSPVDNVNNLQERGFITEAQADQRREKLSEMTWLKYELVIPPNRN